MEAQQHHFLMSDNSYLSQYSLNSHNLFPNLNTSYDGDYSQLTIRDFETSENVNFVRIPVGTNEVINENCERISPIFPTETDFDYEEIKPNPIKSEINDLNTNQQHNGSNSLPAYQRNTNQNASPSVYNNSNNNVRRENNNIRENSSLLPSTDSDQATRVECKKCEKCPFMTIYEFQLENHSLNAHSVSKEHLPLQRTKYLCLGCENTFYEKRSLKIHLECDHQMIPEEANILVQEIVSNTNKISNGSRNNDNSTKSKSRIYLRNVELLRGPQPASLLSSSVPLSVDENTPNALQTGHSENLENHSSSFIDLVSELTEYEENSNNNFLPVTNRGRISIKSIDVLRPPNSQYSTTENQEINNFSNMESRSNSNSLCNQNDNFNNRENFCSSNYQSPEIVSPGKERPRKAKIYIKDVDILKERIFVSPHNFSNLLDTSENLNSFNTCDISSSESLLHSLDNDTSNNFKEIHFNEQNGNQMSENLGIKEPEIVGAKTVRKVTNALHLRTVDELNLMNKNEVQNLITPHLDSTNFTGQNVGNNFSPSSRTCDNFVNNCSQDMCDISTNFMSIGGNNTNKNNIILDDTDAATIDFINPNWTNDYTFEGFEHIIDHSTLSLNNLEEKNTHFDLNTPQRSVNEHDQDQDILFVSSTETDILERTTNHRCRDDFLTIKTPEMNNGIPEIRVQEEENINVLYNLQKQEERINVTDAIVTLDNMPACTVNGSVVVISASPPVDDSVLEKENNERSVSTSASYSVPIEKGRIYVSENLMKDSVNTENTSLGSEIKKKRKPLGRPLGSKKQLKQIGIKVVQEELFKCDNFGCGIKFQKKSTADYHRKCHGKSSNIQCPECTDLSFSSWDTLHTHLWRLHKIDMELYSCTLCDFKTPIQSRLTNTHIKIHSDERNFKCELCSKAFKNSKQLKNHRRLHRTQHSTEEQKTFRCETCGSIFSLIKSLREHICKQTPNNRENVGCKICGKIISSKSSLKLHLLTHEAAKKFKCDFCDYMTNDHNTFRRHKLIHDKTKSYKCTFCNYECIQSNLLKRHVLLKHPLEANKVIFKCSICSFSTINKKIYNMHIVKHGDALTVSNETDLNDITAISTSKGTNKIQFSNKLDNNNTSMEITNRGIKVKSDTLLTDPSKFSSFSGVAS